MHVSEQVIRSNQLSWCGVFWQLINGGKLPETDSSKKVCYVREWRKKFPIALPILIYLALFHIHETNCVFYYFFCNFSKPSNYYSRSTQKHDCMRFSNNDQWCSQQLQYRVSYPFHNITIKRLLPFPRSSGINYHIDYLLNTYAKK